MAARFVLPYADAGNGISPSDGAKLFFYEPGTSTLKNTYSDAAGSTANPNPMVSDSDGVFGNIFISGQYKVVLQDKNGVQIGSWDPVDEFAVGGYWYDTVAAMVAASLPAGVTVYTRGYTTAGDGGQAAYLIKTAADFGGTPDEKGDHTIGNGNVAVLQPTDEVINVKQYGAVGDGVANDTAAIQAALDAATNVYPVFAPSGTYDHTGLTMPEGAHFYGAGQSETILKNTHATNDSVVVPYFDDMNFYDYNVVSDMTIDAENVKSASQAGLSLDTSRHGKYDNLVIKSHYYNIREKASWSNSFSNIHSIGGEYMWWVESGDTTGGTPNTRYNINGDSCTNGLTIDQQGVSATTFLGGSIEGMTNHAIKIVGNVNRSISFVGMNFETNNDGGGYDIILGDDADATSAPSNVLFDCCRFADATGGATRTAFDMNRGSRLEIKNCFFLNYDHVADVSANFGVFTYSNLGGTLTKFSDSTDANTTLPASGQAHGNRLSVLHVDDQGVPTVIQSSSTNDILRSRRHTEAFQRFEITAAGDIGWHNFNTASADVVMGRKAAGCIGVGDGHVIRTGRGATASRPSASTVGAGAMFYDTTLSKPIWSDGTSWKDATGSAV